MVSLKRVTDFLLKEEINPEDVEHDYNVCKFVLKVIVFEIALVSDQDYIVTTIKLNELMNFNSTTWCLIGF